MPTGNFAAGDQNNFVGKKTDFQKIGDLGYFAEVWVRFRPTFAASTQGASVRVDTRGIEFTHQQDVVGRAVWKIVLLHADDE